MMEYINHIISKRSQNELLNAADIQTLYHFAMQSSQNYQYVIDKAAGIKHRHFSDEIELYVPIYISSICRNNCIYCDFRIDNDSLNRRVLNDEQYLRELDFLLERGHRFIEIVGGEGNFDDFLKKVRLTRERLDRFDNSTLASFPGVYGTKELQQLYDAGVDIFICWQETFHRRSYREYHPRGTEKHDYEKRYAIQGNAIQAGIRKTGIAFLAGLYDHLSEVQGLVEQGNHLIEESACEPYIIGTPRFTKVSAAPMKNPACPVSDKQLILQVALCRIAFPQSYIMLSTREDMDMLMRMIDAGANLINAEASTSPGGYTDPAIDNEKQFRHYSYHLDDITSLLSNKGHRPVCKMDKDVRVNAIHQRRLLEIDHQGGTITEFSTKPTRQFMLVKRPADHNVVLGNNYHKGEFESKNPETVILINGSLRIFSHYVQAGQSNEMIVEADKTPIKITVPSYVYHEVSVLKDAQLLEFSSLREDTIDSYSL